MNTLKIKRVSMQNIGRIVLLVILFILMKKTKVVAQYQDVTFKPIEFVQPISKAEWLTRQKAIRKTIREIFGKIPPIPQNPQN